ncbi:unnamed protein product [Linum trigynum]|uniref:Uncharacterized protein n=1 Tax=Linum trigynum TaxID=586398 RepID=A0AAV2D7X8_9ROSI
METTARSRGEDEVASDEAGDVGPGEDPPASIPTSIVSAEGEPCTPFKGVGGGSPTSKLAWMSSAVCNRASTKGSSSPSNGTGEITGYGSEGGVDGLKWKSLSTKWTSLEV